MKYKVLHIPKTGGTALKSSLIPNYRSQNSKYLESLIKGVFFVTTE